MKWHKQILTILGLLTVLSIVPAGFTQSNPSDILLQKARALESQNHLDLAARVWDQVLLSEPNNVEALIGLARYEQQQGNAKHAEEYLKKAQAINPNAGVAPKSSPAQRTPSQSTELTAEQRAKLQEAARLSADHKSEEAMQLYREVFKDRPPDGVLALAYYETLASTATGKTQAISRLSELASRHPDDARYRVAAARILTYTPQTRQQGVRELEEIHGDPKVRDQVQSAWRQALVWEKGNPAYEASMRRYVKEYSDSSLEGDFGPVQPQRSAAEIVHENEIQAGFKALQQGSLLEAESSFELVRVSSPNDFRALMGLGFIRMKQERFAEAVEYLEAASTLEKQKDKNLQNSLETAQFWKQMQEGNASLQQDRLEQASASFHQALLLRPDSADALKGVAGTLMKEGDYSEALPIYNKLIAQNREDKEAWKAWLAALQKSGDSTGVIAAMKTLSASVKTACSDDVEFLVTLAAAFEATGATGQSRQLIQKAIQLSGNNSASTATQLQLAGLLVQVGMLVQATEMYVRLAEQNPQSLDVWRGLIAALHTAEKDEQALAVSARMPRQLFQEATKQADFLMMMASIFESDGQLESAHRYLEQALQIDTQNGKAITANLQLQIAGLWMQEKEYAKAVEAFDQVTRRKPENVDAWRGKLSAMHAARQDSQVTGEFYTMDPNLRERLINDPVIAGILASAYSAEGQKDVALRMIRRAAWQYESMRKPMPVDLHIQTCWILMESGEDANLNTELMSLTARKDLTSQQTAGVQQIWVAWSQKKAERLAALGEYHQALSVLYAARQAFPADPGLRSSFANMLMRAGYMRRAFEDYASWGLVGGTRDDYMSGIGAAVAAHEMKTAESWLQTTLKIWPDDPKVLLMGAKVASAHGDYNRANKYYKAARAVSPPQQQTANGPQAGGDPQSQSQAVRDLASLLAPSNSRSGNSAVYSAQDPQKSGSLDELLYALPNERSAAPLGDTNSSQSAKVPSQKTSELAPWESSSPLAHGGPNPADGPKTLSPAPAENQNDSLDTFLNSGSASPAQGNSANLQSSNRNASPTQSYYASDFTDTKTASREDLSFISDSSVASPANFQLSIVIPSSPHSEVQSEIDAMSAQFSPYVGMGGLVGGRSGQTGFDHLIAQSSDLEASTTLGNEVRLTAIVKPVFLDSGAPTANTTLQLGTLALGSSFAAQSASGVGGEFQVATQNFGVRMGISPQGFLVSNFIGSLVYKPEGGPFQIFLTRAPVRDTLLSYAGVRDPGTNQIWGGVVENGVSGTASWNTSDSGLYAQFGYQYITGDHVETNQRYDGTAGSYWRVLTRPYGSLTVGLNFSAMHYNENLRYFTFGQGGYFSPQSYFLFNVPIHWRGTYGERFEYSVDTSFGSQHFFEDSTPYFPLEVNSQATTAANLEALKESIALRPVVGPKPRPIVPVVPVIPYYPSQTVTSVNYSLNLKAGYRLDRNWFAGAFVDINNARDYTSTSAGIYVRYQPRPASLDAPLTDTYLPQMDSIRGLILP